MTRKVRPLRKPDLSSGEGHWVDPDFFTPVVRQELRDHLVEAPLTDAQKESIVNFCSSMAQCLEEESTPLALQREQILSVQADARRLLLSINAMSPSARAALGAHADYLAYGSRPPIDLADIVVAHIRKPGGGLLSGGWDWAQSVELAAAYAASKYSIDRQSKPGQMRARGFVSLLAEFVVQLTGQLPPKSRATWFEGFCRTLGTHVGMQIGPAIVKAGVEAVHVDSSKKRINVEAKKD